MDIDGEKFEQAVLAFCTLTRGRKVRGDGRGRAFPGRSWMHFMTRVIFRTPQRRTSGCGYRGNQALRRILREAFRGQAVAVVRSTSPGATAGLSSLSSSDVGPPREVLSQRPVRVLVSEALPGIMGSVRPFPVSRFYRHYFRVSVILRQVAFSPSVCVPCLGLEEKPQFPTCWRAVPNLPVSPAKGYP